MFSCPIFSGRGGALLPQDKAKKVLDLIYLDRPYPHTGPPPAVPSNPGAGTLIGAGSAQKVKSVEPKREEEKPSRAELETIVSEFRALGGGQAEESQGGRC